MDDVNKLKSSWLTDVEQVRTAKVNTTAQLAKADQFDELVLRPSLKLEPVRTKRSTWNVFTLASSALWLDVQTYS